MPSLQMLPVAVRRLLARRPWIHWLVVLQPRSRRAPRCAHTCPPSTNARHAWGDAREVLVAEPTHDRETRSRSMCARCRVAVVPHGALEHDASRSATRRSPGRVCGRDRDQRSTSDARGQAGPAALLPDGWAAVPIVESPAAGRADRRARADRGRRHRARRRSDRRRVPRRRHARRCAGGRGGDGRGRRRGRRRRAAAAP